MENSSHFAPLPKAARASGWLALVLLTGLLGCGVAADRPNQDTASKDTRQNPPVPDQETWDLVMMHGHPIGRLHTVIRNLAGDDGPMVRVQQRLELALARDGQVSRQTIAIEGTETRDGRLRSFVLTLHSGPQAQVIQGEVRDGALQVTARSAGHEASRRLPLAEGAPGMLAVDRSLLNEPMQPGQSRTLRMFNPALQQWTQISLQAREHETVELPEGTQELLRIDMQETFTSQEQNRQLTLSTVVWTDATGRALKRHDSAQGLEFVSVSRQRALQALDPKEFDLFGLVMVKLDRPFPEAYEAQRVVYRVALKSGNPAEAFAAGGRQQVRPIDERTAELTVWRGDDHDTDQPVAPPPGEAEQLPGPLIQSDDPQVVEMAQAVAAGERDAWELAKALERHVRRSMRRVDYTQAFASAAEVAQSLRGDCTEHAVLLAALCRARGLPARVALGLVYVPREQAFLYHMWTEVWIDGRWRDLDATLGEGGVTAAHLKLAHSSLASGAMFDSFLSVAQTIGNLQIEVRRAE